MKTIATGIIFFLFPLFLLSACASDPDDSGAPAGGSGGGTGDVGCAAHPLPADTNDVISTFEDGTGAVQQVAGRGGGFYMFNDETGTQVPAPGAEPMATEKAHCDSVYALCTSGDGFTIWGAGMGTDLGPTTGGVKSTYDASGYTGVAFWAIAAEGTIMQLKVGIKDTNTAPEGGVCDPNEPSGDTACHNDWAMRVVMDTEWTHYTILFTELTQDPTWGMQFDQFAVQQTYSIQFQVDAGLPFDFCIDDLVFVK